MEFVFSVIVALGFSPEPTMYGAWSIPCNVDIGGQMRCVRILKVWKWSELRPSQSDSKYSQFTGVEGSTAFNGTEPMVCTVVIFCDESNGGNAYTIHRFAHFATGRDESDNNVKRDFEVWCHFYFDVNNIWLIIESKKWSNAIAAATIASMMPHVQYLYAITVTSMPRVHMLCDL